MGVLDMMREIAKLLPDTAAVEIAISEDRLRLRIAVNNQIVRRTWNKSMLEFSNCAPASPEGLILEAAQGIVGGLEI